MPLKTYYIATGFNWSVGDVISNGNFSESPHKTFFLPDIPPEYSTNPDFIARRNVEFKLESVRAMDFERLPSRKNSMFLNTNEIDAQKWVRKPARNNFSIYEMRSIYVNGAHEANYVWYNYLVRQLKNNEYRSCFSTDPATETAMCLNAYWENISTEKWQCPSRTEVLFDGNLEVVRKII